MLLGLLAALIPPVCLHLLLKTTYYCFKVSQSYILVHPCIRYIWYLHYFWWKCVCYSTFNQF